MPKNFIPSDFNTPMEQIIENKKNIEKIMSGEIGVTKEDFNALESKTTLIENKVLILENNHNSEYNTIEIINKTITPEEWQNNEFSINNVNFKLEGSLISWYPVGNLENLKTCSNSFIFLKEQTLEGTITFGCEYLPTKNVNIIIKVELKGEEY